MRSSLRYDAGGRVDRRERSRVLPAWYPDSGVASGGPAGLDQPGFVGEHDELGAVAGPEFDHGA